MTDDTLGEPAPARRRPLFVEGAAQLGLFAIVAGFWVVFASLAPGFISPFNLFTLGRALAIDIVIGFSTMVVLATGGMNLAIGSIGVSAVTAARSVLEAGRRAGWPRLRRRGVPLPPLRRRHTRRPRRARR